MDLRPRSRLRAGLIRGRRHSRAGHPAGPAAGRIPAACLTTSSHARIRAAKESLGDKLVILGHYYQRDEVVQYADFVGDSFQLANAALTKPEAETIVFCGVHFMAETADILARPEQHVILPNLAAGCSMADMADVDWSKRAGSSSRRSTPTRTDADGRSPSSRSPT